LQNINSNFFIKYFKLNQKVNSIIFFQYGTIDHNSVMWKICSFKGYGSIQTSKMVRDYKFLFQSELSSGLDW